MSDGTCEKCPPHSRAQGDGKSCGPDICKERQKLLYDGTCEQCPPYTRTS